MEATRGLNFTGAPPTGRRAPAHPLDDAPLPDAVLSDITHLLVSEGSPDKVLEAVAAALSELVPHDSLILYRAEAALELLRPVLIQDNQYAEEIRAMGGIPYGSGIAGKAAETASPLLVNDAHLDDRAITIPDTPPDDPESLLAVPLMARDELKGVLVLYRNGDQNHFTIREFKLAILFSELAALAIDNAEIRTRLETEVVTDHLTALYNHRFFHERLAEEMRRANRQHTSVGLVLYDIDDFKRVNDTYGHLVGDQVLQGVAAISRETCRTEDILCRFGGEEFAIILPGAELSAAVALAERLRMAIAGVEFPTVGRITVSVGVSEGPVHAASARELIGTADLALLQAKASGKDKVLVYAPLDGEGPAGGAPPRAGEGEAPGRSAWTGHRTQGRVDAMAARGELRSAAQLRMLQSLSAKLNRLNDTRRIGKLITAELRSLIDYHNCRVFLLHDDGHTLVPIAFSGILTEYQGETYEALLTQVGSGVTGQAAANRQTVYSPDAAHDDTAETIPGTPDLDESLLAVPMLYGEALIGVVVLSKLGIDQFDEEDIRLLEALSASAAVSFENARLLRVEHEAAELSGALLRLSQALTRARGTEGVLTATVGAIPSMIACQEISTWIRDPESGGFRLGAIAGWEADAADRLRRLRISAQVAERWLSSVEEPFVLPKEIVATMPPGLRVSGLVRSELVAPMRWDPDGLGAIVMSASEDDGGFSDRDLQFARGIADIASLALGNAQRFAELERAYVSTIEALANALEAQDEYTSDHARALAEMTLAVGGRLGLEGERLKRLELAALFHDIGKIGVPSEIIRKPGPLTAEERRIMNLHPEIGEQILAPVPLLQPIRPIVRACHERWDGNGYPDGLAGETIPLEARIVFVCDAYHAMTSDRPYRAALPEGEAIRRLKLASGTQFDPEVVAAFVELHRAGRIEVHEHPREGERRTGGPGLQGRRAVRPR